MEWLFIFGLLAAFAGLLHRLRAAERRIESMEQAQEHLLYRFRRSEAGELPQDDRVAGVEEAAVTACSPQDGAPTMVAFEHSAEPVQASEEPEPEAIGAANEPSPYSSRWRFDLEDVFGRRLPIWAGGVALAVSGVFLVRYSIERGLITPLLRVIMAFVFGLGLLAGAEAAYRFRERVADPRVGQALAGAGLATLYAAFYLAGTQYGLIGQTLAFVGLAAVTAGAIALSFRFGLPSAVLGLVGGFAAPLLVGGEEANLPLLALYLGLVTVGLTVSGQRQGRGWLGLVALFAGLGWGAVLLFAGDPGTPEVLALGLYLVVLGAVLPALAGGERYERVLRLASATIASVQLALLVDQDGYSPLAWGLYLLLGAALAFFGWRRADMREANGIAALVSVILLAQWDGATGTGFALVAAAIAAVFGGVPLALIGRGRDRETDVLQLAGTTIGIAAVAYVTFGDPGSDAVEGVLAVAVLALAALAGAAVPRLWLRGDSRMLALALATGAGLSFGAMLLLTPAWAAPLAGAVIFGGLFWLLRARTGASLTKLLWGAALGVAAALAAHLPFEGELDRLIGWDADGSAGISALRWLAVSLVFAALAWREISGDLRRLAETVAVAAIYGTLAQLLPAILLAWAAAGLAIALRLAIPTRVPAQLAALALAALWALEPLGWWIGAAAASLAGDAVFVTDLPAPWLVVTRLLPVLAALAVVPIPQTTLISRRIPHHAPLVLMALVIAHILFKQVFAIASAADFVRFGLAERTVWEGLLLAAAYWAAVGLPRLGKMPGVAIALAGAGLAHFALYTGLLHNPLWSVQALGPLPLANLAAVSYAVAIAAALLLRCWSPPRFAPAVDGGVMLLASFGVLTLLRQAVGGSIPSLAPLGQTEDLLRSLAGIMLALFFLWVGSRRGERSWRVGSLAIMLMAVAKVFLIDAAGLDGLLRVASFMALGFSLIGIGWVYTRQLQARPAE